MLEETPWVLAANTEGERKKNLLELFNLLKLAESNQSSLEKLQELQLPNGAFSWFKGGYEDPYITTYILTGIGRLKRLGAITPDMALHFSSYLRKCQPVNLSSLMTDSSDQVLRILVYTPVL